MNPDLGCTVVGPLNPNLGFEKLSCPPYARLELRSGFRHRPLPLSCGHGVAPFLEPRSGFCHPPHRAHSVAPTIPPTPLHPPKPESGF
ncbi:hypothetical protein TIFTF001_000406 [Ficus carica]|uniref:Uncharacterized protein n=1 Tax=Ficus carica TaxID=3494 RepID=A0AA87Z2Q5_FICCA|nr:hypothetical protein TIFTF001_000406 [Ficus carica]